MDNLPNRLVHRSQTRPKRRQQNESKNDKRPQHTITPPQQAGSSPTAMPATTTRTASSHQYPGGLFHPRCYSAWYSLLLLYAPIRDSAGHLGTRKAREPIGGPLVRACAVESPPHSVANQSIHTATNFRRSAVATAKLPGGTRKLRKGQLQISRSWKVIPLRTPCDHCARVPPSTLS